MDKRVADGRSSQAGFDSFSEREINTIIFGVLLSMLLAALDQTIVAPAMPTIGGALGHADYLPWIVTAYLLTATAVAPLYGKLSDIHGRRPIIYAALIIFLMGSVVSALAPNMFVLIAGRAVQGVGGGGLYAMAQAVIADLVPPRERARYAVWISGTWTVASVAGPLLGGFFAEHLHWSLIFWINLPLGVIAMAIINKPLKRLPVAGRSHSLDALGALLLMLATSCLLLALNWGGSVYDWASPQVSGLLACSMVLSAAFALRLVKAQEPLISIEALAGRVVLTGTLCMFMLQAASVGLAVYLPVYLQATLDLNPSEAGVAMLGLLLGTVIGATISGRMMPRVVHYKRIAVSGLFSSMLCLAGLAFLSGNETLLWVEVLTTCAGFGIGTGFPVLNVAVQNAADRAQMGVVTGAMTFLRSLGAALGVALLGAVALSLGLPLAGEGQSSDQAAMETLSFGPIFLVCSGLLLLALLILALMPERPLRGREPPPALVE